MEKTPADDDVCHRHLPLLTMVLSSRLYQRGLVILLLVVVSSAFVSRGISQRKRLISPVSSPKELGEPLAAFVAQPTQFSRSNTLQLASTMSSSTIEPSLDDATLDQVLQVVVDASKKAGTIILKNMGAEVTERKASSRDLLTLIDPLCEKVIKETILESFPSFDFLGEEDVPPGKEASAAALEAKLKAAKDWLVIADPIDGTTNFVHGMPLSMPSIAVAYKGEVVVGVIYDPYRDELFTSIRGRGAFMNGEPIHVGQEETIGDAIIAMGSPPALESMEMSLRGVKALMPKCRTIRMLGSAALMLAWVANGRLTCYWEYDLSSWDISAGALLIQEAGGRFTDLEGNDFTLSTRKMCATNGKVHDEILRVLREEANVI